MLQFILNAKNPCRLAFYVQREQNFSNAKNSFLFLAEVVSCLKLEPRKTDMHDRTKQIQFRDSFFCLLHVRVLSSVSVLFCWKIAHMCKERKWWTQRQNMCAFFLDKIHDLDWLKISEIINSSSYWLRTSSGSTLTKKR